MQSARMDKNQYELFNILNDIILLKFDCLTPWGKNFITDLHHKALTKQIISTFDLSLCMPNMFKINYFCSKSFWDRIELRTLGHLT
ncbi:hypothetical protein F0256_14760 [Vibrio europaeus]|nr:hypothetical protein [Vibrio europaeus]